jgi:hypothetical protein
MTDADRFQLLFGPYQAPPCRLGDVVFCDVRGEIVVKGMSPGRIPWPVSTWHRRGGKPLLIVCGGLSEAIRRESNQAVCYWWGSTPQTVTKYRKALGVDPATEGTSNLRREHFAEAWADATRAKAQAKARDPERRAKIAAAKRGKPRPAHVREILRECASQPHTEESRRKMSRTHKRRGTRPPRAGPAWTPAEDALLGTMPDAEVADRTGRTVMAVRVRRSLLGVYLRSPDRLTLDQVLARAESHFGRTGRWPSNGSGAVSEGRHLTWGGIDQALRGGFRGLPGGSSLAKLVEEYRRAPPGKGNKG